MTFLSDCQIAALHAAHERRAFAYFMDMGLGKTFTALSEAEGLHHTGKLDVLVVLCPNTFKSGWIDEIAKHGIEADAFLYTSAKAGGARLWVETPVESVLRILVMNDEALRSPTARDIIGLFIKDRKAGLVFDESIRLKDPNAGITKHVMALVFGEKIRPIRQHGRKAIEKANFVYVRLLTGKPQTQGPHDLWAQLLLAGGHVSGYHAFVNRFCVKGGWMNKEIVGVQNVEGLRDIIGACSFTAHKRDWMSNMPQKRYTRRRYSLGPVIQAEYDRMEEEFLAWVEALPGEITEVMVTAAITKYLKLTQLTGGFIIDDAGRPLPLVPIDDNPRLRLLGQILEEAAGKVIICFRHRYVGSLLAQLLANPAVVSGGLTPPEVKDQVQKFNSDPKCKHMLLQIQAGKFGLTLLGDQSKLDERCSTMVFYENSYSLDDRSQIEDRIHRIGQLSEDCLYVDLAGSDMDDRVIQALQRKTNLYEAVMGKERAVLAPA